VGAGTSISAYVTLAGYSSALDEALELSYQC